MIMSFLLYLKYLLHNFFWGYAKVIKYYFILFISHGHLRASITSVTVANDFYNSIKINLSRQILIKGLLYGSLKI